jgi:diguanylate cyclase (GGDEF)-like protein|tara:strand:+ start:2364 stop:2945 length:582 start_codon:yes stop_codon:yes gene_type:complete
MKPLHEIIDEHRKYGDQNKSLREELSKWKKKAKYDDLTGLLRRKTFDDLLEKFVKRADKFNLPLSYILVDIDHFKKVNDTYGHDEGDKVLKEVAKVLADKVRDTDLIGSKIVGRYGGEEMSILLPNTDLEGAKIVGERLRKSIQEEFKGTKTKITISAGVSTYNPEESIEQLYKSADEKLYRAKDQGRNKVIY